MKQERKFATIRVLSDLHVNFEPLFPSPPTQGSNDFFKKLLKKQNLNAKNRKASKLLGYMTDECNSFIESCKNFRIYQVRYLILSLHNKNINLQLWAS